MGKDVLFVKDKIIKFDSLAIQSIKQQAALNLSGKMRYCFHENEEAEMQEMLFVVPRTGYARPHMHKDVAESHVIIDGEGYCIVFNDFGDIQDYFRVSPQHNFLYRISRKMWHMVVPISEQLVIYEIREGKFNNDTNIFPEWAPEENEIEKVKQYKQNLFAQIGETT